jgi:hypothetical protein
MRLDHIRSEIDRMRTQAGRHAMIAALMVAAAFSTTDLNARSRAASASFWVSATERLQAGAQ